MLPDLDLEYGELPARTHHFERRLSAEETAPFEISGNGETEIKVAVQLPAHSGTIGVVVTFNQNRTRGKVSSSEDLQRVLSMSPDPEKGARVGSRATLSKKFGTYDTIYSSSQNDALTSEIQLTLRDALRPFAFISIILLCTFVLLALPLPPISSKLSIDQVPFLIYTALLSIFWAVNSLLILRLMDWGKSFETRFSQIWALMVYVFLCVSIQIIQMAVGVFPLPFLTGVICPLLFVPVIYGLWYLSFTPDERQQDFVKSGFKHHVQLSLICTFFFIICQLYLLAIHMVTNTPAIQLPIAVGFKGGIVITKMLIRKYALKSGSYTRSLIQAEDKALVKTMAFWAQSADQCFSIMVFALIREWYFTIPLISLDLLLATLLPYLDKFRALIETKSNKVTPGTLRSKSLLTVRRSMDRIISSIYTTEDRVEVVFQNLFILFAVAVFFYAWAAWMKFGNNAAYYPSFASLCTSELMKSFTFMSFQAGAALIYAVVLEVIFRRSLGVSLFRIGLLGQRRKFWFMVVVTLNAVCFPLLTLLQHNQVIAIVFKSQNRNCS